MLAVDRREHTRENESERLVVFEGEERAKS